MGSSREARLAEAREQLTQQLGFDPTQESGPASAASEGFTVMKEILDIYPRLKGVQIVDDNGKEMFEGTRGKWLIDSTSQRTQIINRMKNWRAFSDSSPADAT